MRTFRLRRHRSTCRRCLRITRRCPLANSAALDGSKKAVAERNHCKEVVVKILDQLAKYVQANCKEDMTIFLSSGFKAQSSTKTKPATASEKIRSIKLGPNSGQAQVRLV